MSAFYDHMTEVAKNLLVKFGETSTLKRRTPGTPPDADKPWVPGSPTVTSTFFSGAWLNESITTDPGLVKDGEAFVIAAASDLSGPPDPSIDHVERADGTRYSLLSAQPINPAGQSLIYELKVKR